ncbi:hypothetical protein QAD02_001281 [Eretmocerus hayati]|uniref:Uncharacterized protein n=1 Tax=Eretmocerus hayati TaxID=131215 RepID=A0ACC2NFT5_9HYME|nr:hypothetical protein QAD02_001281 [Eretmocerus hayati]
MPPTRTPKASGRPKKRPGYFFSGSKSEKERGEIIDDSEGRNIASDLFKSLLEKYDPLIVSRIGKMFEKKKKKEQELLKSTNFAEKLVVSKHTKESGLAFYIEHRFTKRSYSELVKDYVARLQKKRAHNIYPSYRTIKEAMKECLPPQIQGSEKEVFAPLQQVANKTSERLCESIATEWSEEALKRVKLTFSGSFDGATGYSSSHQKCASPDDECNDVIQTIFVSSLTPLQLISESVTDSNTYTWLNSTPASYRYCRPLRVAFEKETKETISREYHRITSEIHRLQPHRFRMASGKDVKVTFECHLTMCYGECVNCILQLAPSERCSICERSTHEFGDKESSFYIEEGSKSSDLGFALVHAEMKMFEYLLHLSYQLEIEVSKVLQEYRDDFDAWRSVRIENVEEELGIKTVQVTQGRRITNTGNLARRCFKEPQKFAACLKLDECFIVDLADILILFKTKERVDYTLLEEHCWRVYWKHYELYPWAHMNVAIHELLMHGCRVAKKLPLPICYFSEDSQQAWHKFFRPNMVKYARQFSKAAQILDVYRRAMYQSDPLISNILLKQRSKHLEKGKIPQRLVRYILPRYIRSPCSDVIQCGADDSDDGSTTSDEDTDDLDSGDTDCQGKESIPPEQVFTDYRSVYTLRCRKFAKKELDECIRNASVALMGLAKYSNIFGKKYALDEVNTLMKNDAAIFVGALLLKFNFVTISMLTTARLPDPSERYKDSYSSESVGSDLILNPITLMALRGCVPNIQSCIVSGVKVGTFALQPIKKGTKLCLFGRGNIYDGTSKRERQAKYFKFYNSQCVCEAYTKNWPDILDDSNKLAAVYIPKSGPVAAKELRGEINAITAELRANDHKPNQPDHKLVRRIGELVPRIWEHFSLPAPETIRTVKLMIEIYQRSEYGNAVALIVTIFCKAYNEVGSIDLMQTQIESLEKIEDKYCGEIPREQLFTDYRSVYTSRCRKFNKQELDECIRNASVALMRLAKYSNIFGKKYAFNEAKKLMKNDAAIFVGALLLKFNLVTVSKLTQIYLPDPSGRCNDPNPSESVGLDLILNPTTLMASLGCVPNVHSCAASGVKVVTYALQPIKKGTKLYLYQPGTIYDGVPKLTRQARFFKNYNSQCVCEACTKNWSDILDDSNKLAVMNLSKSGPAVAKEFHDKIDAITAEFKAISDQKPNQPDIKLVRRIRELVSQIWEHFSLPAPVVTRAVKLMTQINVKFYSP